MSLLLLFKGGGVQGITVRLNSIGEQAVSSLPVGMGIQDIQSILNDITGENAGIQVLNQVISGDPAKAIQVLSQTINERDLVYRIQKLIQTVGDLGLEFQGSNWDIYLDGSNIKNLVTSAEIEMDESSVHNQLTLNSISRELFRRADPYVRQGTSRIEVHIGARVIYFLLEEREGDEVEFSLWGRSASARDDVPYCDTIDIEGGIPRSAKETAESMLSINSLDWQVYDIYGLLLDWVLPDNYEFSGDPLEGIQDLADAIGATVRSKDDGTILVRNRYPVRPIDMPKNIADINFDRLTNLINLNYTEERGGGYDVVEVYGYAPDNLSPDMELEEDTPNIGDEVHVRVYWEGTVPSVVEKLVTDGLIIYQGIFTESKTEIVQFRRRTGSATKPIKTLDSFEWFGTDGGIPQTTNRSKTITIGEDFAVGRLTYTTEYRRYRLYAHYVEVLLDVLTYSGLSDSSVRVRMGDGHVYAPSISDGLLTSWIAALTRGTAYLDDVRYTQKVLDLRVPYDELIRDGLLVYVNDAEIDCVGNYHINTARILFNGPQIVCELMVTQPQVE